MIILSLNHRIQFIPSNLFMHYSSNLFMRYSTKMLIFLHEDLIFLKNLDLLLSLFKLIPQASDLIPQQFVLSNNFLHVFQILPGAPVLLIVLKCNMLLAVVAKEIHLALGLQMMQRILALDGGPTSGTVDLKFRKFFVKMPL